MNALILYMYEKIEMIKNDKNTYVQFYTIQIISYKEFNDLSIIILKHVRFKHCFFL